MAQKQQKKKQHASITRAQKKVEANQCRAESSMPVREEDKLALADLTLPGKVAWFALLALVFFVPLALSNLTFLGFSLPFSSDLYDTIKVAILRIGSALALFAWIYDILKYGGKIRTSPLYWIFGAFLLWATASTIFSVSPVTAFFGKYRRYEGLWSYGIYAVLFFVVVQYATNELRVKMIAKTLVFSSAIVALYGLGQSVGIEPIMKGASAFEAGRSYSTYGNPDLLAGFLAFGVFVSFGLALGEHRRGWRVVYWLILLMNSAVSITAYSRSIWVAIVVGMGFMILFAVRQSMKPEKSDYVFMGGTLLATAVYALRSLSRNDAVTNIANRIISIFQFKSGSALTRFEIWDAAIKAIKDRPLFGFGPDTFRLVFRRYAPVSYAQDAGYLSVADNVHNYILQLAASVGIIGMLLFYGMGTWVAFLTFKLGFTPCKKDPSISTQGRLILGGIWVSCFAYMVHLSFGLSLPGATFLFIIFMGCLVAPLAHEKEVEPLSLAPFALGIGSIAFVAITVFSLRLYIADYDYLKGLTAQQANDPIAAIGHFERAIKLNPFVDRYRTEYFNASAAAATNALNAAQNKQMSSQEAQTYLSEAIKTGTQAITFMPWEYDNYSLMTVFYVQVADLTGDPTYYKKAISLAEAQLKLTPTGLALRYGYAAALAGEGRLDEAIEQAKICATQDTNFAQAKELLARLEQAKTQGAAK